MKKSSAPSSLERYHFETVFRSEKNELKKRINNNAFCALMSHCYWFILKRDITSDRNTV